MAEGLKQTREGAAAALLGRCDQYGDEEVEYRSSLVVLVLFSDRKLLFDFRKALLFCLYMHTALAPTNSMVQSCILAKCLTRQLTPQPQTQAASWTPPPEPGAGTPYLFLGSGSATFILKVVLSGDISAPMKLFFFFFKS